MMSEAIKTQVLLNKDHDMAYYLEAAETEMNDNGTFQSINLNSYYDQEKIISPRNLIDIMKSVTPRISMINRVIHRNFRAAPQFLLTGVRTGALLESMQSWIVKVLGATQAEGGYVSEQAGSFAKQTILVSPAITDNKVYSLYKAPSDNLSRTVMIDFVYKPLYIIEEITNSMKRTFVKSRTAIELCRPEALGCLEIQGMDDILGPDYSTAKNIVNEVL